MKLNNKKILFLMSGSVAAFKAVSVISELKKAGADLKIAATPKTFEFIGAATLRAFVGDELYSDEWKTGKMEHIELERWADLIVFCPATANKLNEMRAGLGSDLVSTIWLAHTFKKPFTVFPAMNKEMWAHPATQESVKYLKNIGVRLIDPASGELACGEVGMGRMLEPSEIIKILSEI